MNDLAWLPSVTLDIRESTFEQFLFRISFDVSWSYYIDDLDRADPSVRDHRLSQDLGITTKGRTGFYTFAAKCYCLTPTPWSLAWTNLRDGTLGEVHQRLWHEANMYGHPDDRCDYPLSPLCKQPVPQPDT